MGEWKRRCSNEHVAGKELGNDRVFGMVKSGSINFKFGTTARGRAEDITRSHKAKSQDAKAKHELVLIV